MANDQKVLDGNIVKLEDLLYLFTGMDFHIILNIQPQNIHMCFFVILPMEKVQPQPDIALRFGGGFSAIYILGGLQTQLQ